MWGGGGCVVQKGTGKNLQDDVLDLSGGGIMCVMWGRGGKMGRYKIPSP